MAKKAAQAKKTGKTSSRKQKAEKTKTLSNIERTVAAVRQKFGNSALMRMDAGAVEQVDTISTGSLQLDRALGIGGWPRGRIVELFGHESGGKTTMALHGIANAQKNGGVVAFVDAEHALDPNYARALGVKVDELLVSQPDYGEQALEIVDELISTGGVDMIVIDSVTALTPKAELDGEMGDKHMGLQARMMSQAMRKLTAKAHKTNTCVLFINQIRMKIGVVFGNPETTTGGRALRFYSSVRIDVRRRTQLKDPGQEDPIGNIHRAKVIKNKLAPPFRTAEFEIIYGRGIDQHADLLNIATELGIIQQSGAWYSWTVGGGGKVQGRFTLRNMIADDPKLQADLLAAVLQYQAK